MPFGSLPRTSTWGSEQAAEDYSPEGRRGPPKVTSHVGQNWDWNPRLLTASIAPVLGEPSETFLSPGPWHRPGLPLTNCFYLPIPPSVVGAATSCQLTPGARHKSNQQLPASLGLPRPRAAEPSQLQALSCPTAAPSRTPGLLAGPPALLRQQTALALATSQPTDPGRKPDSQSPSSWEARLYTYFPRVGSAPISGLEVDNTRQMTQSWNVPRESLLHHSLSGLVGSKEKPHVLPVLG